jgi:hypothetical protein
MPGPSRSSSRTRAPSGGAGRGHAPGRAAAGPGRAPATSHAPALGGPGPASLGPDVGGWALQAAADGSLPALLRHADGATGERVIGAIQRSGGNQLVQRIVVEDGLQPGEKAEPMTPSAPPSLDAAPSADTKKSTLEEIEEIVGGGKSGGGNLWVGPLDELKLGRLWSRFGDGIADAVDQNPDLWARSKDRGMELTDIGAANIARDMLSREVKATANEYLVKNLKDADAAIKELGFDEKTEGKPTEEQAEKRRELEFAAIQLKELRKVKGRLENQIVGYTKVGGRPAGARSEGEDFEGFWPVHFTPGGPPPIAWNDAKPTDPYVAQTMTPAVPYDDVMAQWKPVSGALLALADENPVLFAALQDDKLGQVAGEEAVDPSTAMKDILAGMRAAIVDTTTNLNSGSLDWHELKPIHRQLIEGEKKTKTDWSKTFFKEVAKETVGDYESAKFVADIGIGLMSAVAFVFAELASGGLATALLIGGLGIGIGQSASKWNDWGTLKDAAGSAASSKTELVGKEQADAALIEAILQTAFTALDAWQAAKSGLKIAGAYAASKAGAKAAAVEGLEAIGKAAAKGAIETGSKEAVEKAVVELGVEQTASRLGVAPDKLASLLPAGSPAASRVAEYLAVLGEKVADNVDLKKVLANIGQEAAERGAKEADKLALVALERYGPRETLSMAGGWKNLASALGAESSAGRQLLAWRDSIYRDLKQFIAEQIGKGAKPEELEALIKETGTIENFTNDLDMSFLGKDASANRSLAVEFLAARAGLPANAGTLDKLLYIGLFTDPRRLHMFDKFPELAADLSKKTATFEEQLMWNGELKRVAKNEARAAAVRARMEELGIKVIEDFVPLSERAVAKLGEQQDVLVGEIEKLAASEAPDKLALAGKLEELANVQAQINVKEGGGYFSGGGVRRFVTEDPKNPFPGYGPGEMPGKGAAMEHGAALDQVMKLRKSVEDLAAAGLKGPAGMSDLAGSIKSIGKYGSRFVEAAKALGIKLPEEEVFNAMAVEFERILKLARGKAEQSLQAAMKEDMAKLMGDVEGAIAKFDSCHMAIIKELRTQAGLVGREAVAGDIVKATLNRYRWLTFKGVLLQELGSAGRLIDAGVGLGSDEAAPAPDGAAPAAE